MQAHEERVVTELEQLEDRHGKLKTFINDSPTFPKLPGEDQELMIEQLRVMTKYAQILRARIARFPKA